MTESGFAVVPLFGLVTLLFAAGATLLHTTLVALGGGGQDENDENTEDGEVDSLNTGMTGYGSTASANTDSNEPIRNGSSNADTRQYCSRGHTRVDADSCAQINGGSNTSSNDEDDEDRREDGRMRTLAADTRSRVLAAAAALELSYSCAHRAEEAEKKARAHADAVEMLWARPHAAFDEFVRYVERRGVVSLSCLTKCFMLDADDVAAVLRGLCACGKLHGYLDERGNFVCTARPPQLAPLPCISTPSSTATSTATSKRVTAKRPRPPLMTT